MTGVQRPGGSRKDAGQTKIRQVCVVLKIQQDITGFYIPVDNVLGMQVIQGTANFSNVTKRFVQGDGLLQLECAASNIRGDQIPQQTAMTQAVDGEYVGMVQVGQDIRLAVDQLVLDATLFRIRDFTELDGYDLFAGWVDGGPDYPLPAGSDLLQQTIVLEKCSGDQVEQFNRRKRLRHG
jgi:hypothetical protein